jgi:outer membrane receptor for ferrienterochelin and colicins
MKTKINLLFLIISGLLSVQIIAQNTIIGNVTDDNGMPLSSANVKVEGTNEGVVTDFNGNFTLNTSKNFPISLLISYIGFETQSLTVESASPIQIGMEQGNVFDEVIVSASRRVEKLQEAPAAVSVLNAEQLSNSGGAVSPIRALINTPGVELQQQTGQRINLALRGSSGVFSTGVFPMLDYRSLISPGLEFFDSQNSPINNIDLERIEVVLGPGSALYGPDVTSGVVHFISKSPFKHPGTTAELIYGERNTTKVAIRHASHNEDNTFGYKINARYGSGQDFVLDPNNADDQKILKNFKTEIRRAKITPEGAVDTENDGPLLLTTEQKQLPDYWAGMVNTSLYFRPKNGMEIITSGGWNAGKAIFYNELGEGVSHSNEYWAQVRFNYKGWFAQTYYIKNDGGNDSNPVYLNRTGLIVPLERSHYEAQLQYNFDLPNLLDSEWTLGVDFRNALSDTQNHVYGRFEDDDDYVILGGYAQGKFKMGEKFDMFLAGRYDGYNFTNEKTFSPRAALVYKLNENHNFRVSYNRAANPIPASDIYFDLPIQRVPGVLDIWNMGGKNPYTFGANPQIDWLIPGVPNTNFKDGFPLSAAYSFVNDNVIEQLVAIGGKDPSLAPIVPLIESLLRGNTPDGFSPVSSFDEKGNTLLPEDGETVLISRVSALEFGYKGLFWDKLALGFDIYHLRSTAGGGFTQVSPMVNIEDLPNNLGNSVQSKIEPQLEQALISMGQPQPVAQAIATKVGEVLNDAYNAGGQGFLDELSKAGLPFHGVVPTEQAPIGNIPKLIYGYITRDPDKINTNWGFETHSKYYFSDIFTTYFNYTWFNRSSGEPGDLNFPQNKIRWGMSYQPEKGIVGSVSYQWNQAYKSNQTTFPGRIDALSVFDVMAGYNFNNGLKIHLSAVNLFNNEFRALPGMPRIGRTFTTRLLYDF